MAIDREDTSETEVEKKTIGESRTTPGSNRDEERQLTSLKSTVQVMPLQPAPTDAAAPATPVRQKEGNVLPSPQTEEIHRGKIPTSLESICSPARSPMSSPPTEVTSLREMILEAVRSIHGFSKYQHGIPREVHSMILQTLQEDRKEALGVPNLGEWSDGSSGCECWKPSFGNIVYLH